MASWLRALGRTASRAVSAVPGARSLLKAIPGVGLAYGALEIGQAALGFGGGGGDGAFPPMPGGGGAYPVPGGPGAPPMMGKRSIFRDDPNVAAYLKQFAIPTRGLKPYFRAPRGFVVLRDGVGDAYGLPKNLAKQYAGWRPAKTPPISVRDWSAMTRAKVVMRKLSEIDKQGRRLAAFGARGRGRGGPIRGPGGSVY